MIEFFHSVSSFFVGLLRLAALISVFCIGFTISILSSTKMFTQRIWLGCLRQLASSNKGRLAHTAPDPQSQYDVSEKMRKLFELKQKQRETTKAYYQKIVMNPYRAKLDEVPFDPVLFRYNALMTCHDEYVDLNMKNTFFLFSLYIFPMAFVAWYISYRRGNKERQYRAGEIAYEHRNRGTL